jgi:hypothetical protein
MRNRFIIILLLLSVSTIKSQTNIAIENNVFKIDGSSFFPLGWYDVSISDLKKVKQDNANVVLPIWTFFIRENNNKDFGAKKYLDLMKVYLDSAQSNGLKIIVELPAIWPDNSSIDKHNGHFAYIDTLVPGIKNYPALLGWYIADEPEWHGDLESYSSLQDWYKRIKTLDSVHPVFLCCGNGNDLAKFTEKYFAPPVKNLYRFYDVLMEDRYVIDSSHHSNFSEFDSLLQTLYHGYNYFKDNGLNSTTMLVAQGYGYPLTLGSGKRAGNPSISEIQYEAVSSFEYAQRVVSDNSVSKNAGGILFWRYNAANDICKNNMREFMQYFTSNKLDLVIRSANVNNLVTIPSSPTSFNTFVRKINNTYYLFAINRSDNNATINFDLNIGNCTSGTELPIGQKPKTINLNSKNGQCIFTDTYRGRETKIYKIMTTL